MHGLTTIALRYSNVYGPRQNPHGEAGVVAIFSQKGLAGKAPTIFGDGAAVRDYVHVSDVAAANVRALTGEVPAGFSAFNVGTAIATDVNALAAAVRDGVKAVRPGSDPPAAEHGPDRSGDLNSSVVDPSAAKAGLGWEPTVPFHDGIEQTVRYFASLA